MKDQCSFVLRSGHRCTIAGWHMHYPAWLTIDDALTRTMLIAWATRKRKK